MKFLIIAMISLNIFAQKIVIISDLNGSYGSKTYGSEVSKAISKINEINPSVVLITGDMIAGMKAGLDYQGMWDSFTKTVRAPLEKSSLLVAPTPGNHDGSAYDKYYDERVLYREQWKKTDSKLNFISAENYPFYYSFKVNSSLFISLDVTVPGSLPKKQRDWLIEQLEKSQDFQTKVVFSHLPLFPFAKNREQDAMFDLELEKILNDYNVSYFLSGHHHAFYPGKRVKLKLISQSCLGSGPRSLIGDDKISPKSFTVIDLDKKDNNIEALIAPSYSEKVNIESLPLFLNEGKYQIERIDQ